MPHIDINHTQYYYELHGQGKPLVLIAGYSCDYTFWDPLLKHLTQHFQVCVFDNRGIGQTQDNGEALTLEKMAAETAQLIHALSLKRPIIVGHSMGGIIAHLLVKQDPDNFEKLIIINSAQAVNPRSLMALASFLTLLEQGASIDTVIEASMPWFFSSGYLSDPQNIAAFKEILINNPHPPSLADLSRQLNALQRFSATPFNASPLTVPMLVIISQEDIICLPQESHHLASKIKAQEIILPGGHSTPLEIPKLLGQTIYNFLRSK